MLNKKGSVLWGLVVLSLVVGIYSVVVGLNGPSEGNESNKNAYVDLPIVFSKFEMKVEMQRKLEKDLLSKQSVLDSLMFRLQSLNNQLENEEKPKQEDILKFQQLQNYYAQQKQTVEIYSQEQTAKYDQQILEQMTQYIKDFGEKNGYSFIYGADNSGVILYAPEANNITEEVVAFINNSYQGKN